jgi:hypothetical protein
MTDAKIDLCWAVPVVMLAVLGTQVTQTVRPALDLLNPLNRRHLLLLSLHHLSHHPETMILNLDRRMLLLLVLKVIMLFTTMVVGLFFIPATLLLAPAVVYGMLLNVSPVGLKLYHKLSLTCIYLICLQLFMPTTIFSLMLCWGTKMVRLMLGVEFQAFVRTVEMLLAKRIHSALPATL